MKCQRLYGHPNEDQLKTIEEKGLFVYDLKGFEKDRFRIQKHVRRNYIGYIITDMRLEECLDWDENFGMLDTDFLIRKPRETKFL